jgi:hypothetical protein
VAGDSGDEVLQLEEGKREVREHLAEEKVARGSSSKGWGVAAAVVTPRVSKPHDYANHMFMRL